MANPDPAAVNSMFGRIAARYDLANRTLSGGFDLWWRRRLVRGVVRQHPELVVDLATGSGDVALALRKKLPSSTRVLGLDFCEPMLEEARRKAPSAEACGPLEFAWGDILELPLEDDACDVITIAFGLRNLADRHRGLCEMMRVLRPGGTLLILEFTQPARWFRPFYYAYLRHVLPRVAGWISGDRDAYEYLNNTIGAFPDKAGITAELEKAGFRDIRAVGMTASIVALHQGRA